MLSDSDFDRMFLEEMKRQVAVREGEKVEKTTIERAAVRAIALKAAKGDAKAFKAVMDRRAAIDKRQQIEWENLLKATLEYQVEARRQLVLEKKLRRTGREIIPHPDDIEIDLKNRTINCNGPVTADQKMAQDFLMSNGAPLTRQFLNPSHSVARDRRLLRQARKINRQMEEVSRVVAKRASKINSWERATLEERTEFLRKDFWPTFSEKLPLPLAQSELCFKSAFRSYLKIELTEEEDQELIVEVRKAFHIESGGADVEQPSDGSELP